MQSITCVTVLVLLASASAHAKTERGLYTAERVEVMRENLAEHEWARAIRDAAVARADKLVGTPMEELAAWVPDPRIPSAAYVHETGCPNCGLECRKFGNYPWIISGDKPWKVECPNCHNVYPSNDFQEYLETALEATPERVWDETGTRTTPKIPRLEGDRSLLTGEFADDGYGWTSPDHDQKYWFVAWYNKWMITRRLLPAITDLSEAYLYTDEPKYAEKCAVLLWQLAEYYPDYDYTNKSRYGTEVNSAYYGRLQYHTWECFTVDVCVRAYDAIFPALVDGVAAEAAPGLEEFAGKGLEEIRGLIEEQLLRNMAWEIVNETRVIAGNYGMHQKGLLEIAAVLKGTPGDPSSEQMVDWILNNEEYSLYTFMPLYDALYNLIYRDGVPFESPGYSLHWVEDLSVIADLLKLNGVDVYQEPRFRKLYDWTIQMITAGNFTPALGDSGNMSNRGTILRESVFLAGFRAYGDPIYAKALMRVNANAGNDLFEEPIGDALKAAAAEYEGELGYDDQHLAGYGLATLQSGGQDDPFAVGLFYGRFVGHSKRDKMHLDIFAENCSMIPNFGYPETANSNDPRRAGFFWNTVSHNTVVVDESMQADGRGRCLAYDVGDGFQYVEARNDDVYPQCDEYRRSVATVDVADARYVIDIFRVKGGEQHDWIVYGSHADLASNLELSEPRAGTLAGEDVDYGHFYDDEVLGAAKYGTVGYFGYRGSGYQFLKSPREAELTPGGHVKWDFITSGDRALSQMQGNEGAFLKAHLIGEGERVIACDGVPQQNQSGTPETVKFVVRRRVGEDLNSTFGTVFEPGAGETIIQSVERLRVGGENLVALMITLADGARHYYFNATEPVAEVRTGPVRFSGTVGFVATDADGEVTTGYARNGSKLAIGEWQLESEAPTRATVTACDYGANTIALDQPVGAAVGTTAIVDSGAYGASFVVTEISDGNVIHFGDQHPAMARAAIVKADPETRTLASSTLMNFALPGLHVVNEAMEAIGQVESMTGGIVVDREFEAEQFADTNGDGLVHAYLMEYGPGDAVELPTSARYVR